MSIFSAHEKLNEIKRELALRRRFYPKWIFEQRMSQADADKQIAIFEAIAEDYRAQCEFDFDAPA